jgi:MFS family permease
MRKKLWTKHFFLLIVTTLALGISGNMLNSPLPIYARYVGANNLIAGLVTGLFALSALLCRPIVGKLLDSKGRKTIFILGILVYSIIVFSYNWASTIGILLVLRFLQGIGMSAYTTASGTIAADLIPNGRLIEGFGYYGMIQTVAMAVGPMLGLILIESGSFSYLFNIAFFLGIAGLIAVFFIGYEKNTENSNCITANKYTDSCKTTKGKGIIERTAIPTSIATFFIAIIIGIIMTFLPSYAASYGIKGIGIYFTVNAMAVFSTRIFVGKLTARFGISKVLISGLTILAISMIYLSFSSTLFNFLIVAILNGLGNGIISPIMNSFVIKFCHPERRGVASATYYSSLDVGIGGGSVLGGIVMMVTGYRMLYLLSAICAAISFVVYFISIRKQLAESDAAVAQAQKDISLESEIEISI